MPQTIIIPPNEISFLDFTGGFMPDLAEQAVPLNGLIDVSNLLPDRETGTLEVRRGFARFSDLNVANYKCTGVFPFTPNDPQDGGHAEPHLIATIRQVPRRPGGANDLQVWDIDINAETATRIDTAGREWRSPGGGLFGETVDSFFYGGWEVDPIFSYKPVFKDGTTNPRPWEPDATMGQFCSTEWVVDTAYVAGDRRWDTITVEKIGGGTREVKYVFICTAAHTSKSWNRPGKIGVKEDRKWENLGKYIPEWADATEYEIGDTVSYEVTTAALFKKFPRSYESGAGANKKSTFICTRDHTSSAGNNEPPGNSWEPYRAPISNVGIFHGSRLFVRDGDHESDRLRYSGLVTADGFWDPTEWESDDIQGAGFMDIRTGDGDPIRGLASLNQYLIIMKRYSTWALSGYNPSTWTLRQISDTGVVFKRAVCVHEGICYYFNDEGLFQTDGVVAQEVPNANVVRDWLRDNIDVFEDTDADGAYRANLRVSMTSFMGFIWISLPLETMNRARFSLVYDPKTGSFWKQTMEPDMITTQRTGRVDEMYFANNNTPALVMRYEGTEDDTGVAVQAFQNIAWMARLAWATFGPWREQRRIRRFWTRIRAAVGTNLTIKYFRDYATTAFKTINRTTTYGPVSEVEGESVRDKDPYAISVEISGDRGSCSLISAHMQTQYRRRRYNRGARA